MKIDKKSFMSLRDQEKIIYSSSNKLLNTIISLRKNIIKSKPPFAIDKTICKNGCRLGSD